MHKKKTVNIFYNAYGFYAISNLKLLVINLLILDIFYIYERYIQHHSPQRKFRQAKMNIDMWDILQT